MGAAWGSAVEALRRGVGASRQRHADGDGAVTEGERRNGSRRKEPEGNAPAGNLQTVKSALQGVMPQGTDGLGARLRRSARGSNRRAGPLARDHLDAVYAQHGQRYPAWPLGHVQLEARVAQAQRRLYVSHEQRVSWLGW
jgi:hypothetical protein